MRRSNSSAWGHPPLPLIPAALRREFGQLEAPPSLCRALGRKLSLAELDRNFWRRHDEIGVAAAADLLSLVQRLVARCADREIAPRDLRRRIDLDSVPVSARTRAALRRAFDGDSVALEGLSFRRLLSMPSVGIKRALELSCALESAAPQESPVARSSYDLEEFYASIRGWAARELGRSTLVDILPAADPRWPLPIATLWEKLRQSSIDIPGTGGYESDGVPVLLARGLDPCSEVTVLILRARVLSGCEPTRLEVLSAALGETPARVLELERRGLECLQQFQEPEYAPVLRRARRLSDSLGAAMPVDAAELDEALARVVGDFPGAELRKLAEEILLWLAGPYRRRGGWWLTGENLIGRTVQAILDARSADGAISTMDLRGALERIGVRAAHHDRWIDWVIEVAKVECKRGPGTVERAASSEAARPSSP